MSNEPWVHTNRYLISKSPVLSQEWLKQKSKHLLTSDFGAAVGHNKKKSAKKLAWELANGNGNNNDNIENVNNIKNIENSRDKLRQIEIGKVIYGQASGLPINTMSLCVSKIDSRFAIPSCSYLNDNDYGCVLVNVKYVKRFTEELRQASEREYVPGKVDHIPQNDYDEMQGMMFIAGVGLCDYVVYCSRTGSLFVQRIGFNQAYWNDLHGEINKFFQTYFSKK